MIYLHKIIVLIGRIIIATFASFFIFVFVYMAQTVIGLLSYDFSPFEILNYHIACYSLHIVSTCEIHYFWLMDFWLEALPDGISSYLSKNGVFDFVNDFFAGYYSLLFIKGIFEYGIPSLTALLMFKFIRGDTKTKNKTKRIYKENQSWGSNWKAVLSILFGGFGVGRFYLGYYAIGIVQISVIIVTASLGGLVWGVWEGVLLLMHQIDRDTQNRPLKLQEVKKWNYI